MVVCSAILRGVVRPCYCGRASWSRTCRVVCLVGWLVGWRAATIRENILQGRPGASEDDMIAAAKMANAHQFISDFANGYDTFCGEGGKQLSGQSVSRRMPSCSSGGLAWLPADLSVICAPLCLGWDRRPEAAHRE